MKHRHLCSKCKKYYDCEKQDKCEQTRRGVCDKCFNAACDSKGKLTDVTSGATHGFGFGKQKNRAKRYFLTGY